MFEFERPMLLFEFEGDIVDMGVDIGVDIGVAFVNTAVFELALRVFMFVFTLLSVVQAANPAAAKASVTTVLFVLFIIGLLRSSFSFKQRPNASTNSTFSFG